MEYIELLEKEGCSCIVGKAGEIKHKVFGTGIKPLLQIYQEHQEDLENSDVCDKIIGKAAAMILVLGKVRNVYAKVISKRALEFLKAQKISVAYDTMVDEIQNRAGTGMCPMENLVKDTNNPQEGLTRILEFIKK